MSETVLQPYKTSAPILIEMVSPENEIFKSVKQGNVKAYETLFRQYYEPLCQYANRMIKDHAEAEEVVQQVFITIWSKRESIEIETSLKSYLYRAVNNVCLNKIKQQKNKSKHHSFIQYQSSGLVNSTVETVFASELEKQMYKAIDDLPEQCRLVFQLSRFEGMRYQEIADELNISVKTVENQIGKALKILRERLKDYIPFLVISLTQIFW